MKVLWAGLTGALFGVGLVISGMTQPDKIIGFLDVAGEWDPTLAFVMGGAIAVHAPLRWWVLRRERPLLETDFDEPQAQIINGPLILGAALFGVGWGMSGFCPGPAITSIGPSSEALLFCAGMGGGMVLYGGGRALLERRQEARDSDGA
jgi:uncharacterized protein